MLNPAGLLGNKGAVVVTQAEFAFEEEETFSAVSLFLMFIFCCDPSVVDIGYVCSTFNC